MRIARQVRVANRRQGTGLWWRVLLFVLGGSVVLAPQLAAVVALNLYFDYAKNLPLVPDLDEVARDAPRTSRIVAADGSLLARIPFSVDDHAGHRDWTPFSQLPKKLVDAILAAEDVRFFEHYGVDVRAVLRAAWTNYRAGRFAEGASTLTQQLARALLPKQVGRDMNVRRKIREAIVARRIERKFDKERILETYANHIFLGEGAYGMAAAGQVYFSKELAELSLAEAALLAGLAQAPTARNPVADLAGARRRRDSVLDKMRRAGFVTPAAATAAKMETIALRPRVSYYGRRAPWLMEKARREIAEGEPAVYARGGLRIETTVLPATVAAAIVIGRAGVNRLAHRQRKQPVPQFAAFFYDHETGYIEAGVGGASWKNSRYDRTEQACRQPGSAFKPIIYAAAIEHNVITLATPLRDGPITEYDQSRDTFWKPRNSGRTFRTVALAHQALASSLNSSAVDVLGRVGIDRSIAMARRLGITSHIAPVFPMVLGASCVHVHELARAYSAFARLGRIREPIVVVRVFHRGRQVLDRASPYDPFLAPARRLDRAVAALTDDTSRTSLSPESAYLMSTMLRGVVTSGTGQHARRLDRPAAGKTGTTNENIDAWFVGYTGRLVGAVWIGHDDPSTSLGRQEDGSHAALPLWVEFVALLEGRRRPVPVPGEPPPGVVRARIDRETGLLARPGPGALELFFKEGTLPTQVAGDRDLPANLERLTEEF